MMNSSEEQFWADVDAEVSQRLDLTQGYHITFYLSLRYVGQHYNYTLEELDSLIKQAEAHPRFGQYYLCLPERDSELEKRFPKHIILLSEQRSSYKWKQTYQLLSSSLKGSLMHALQMDMQEKEKSLEIAMAEVADYLSFGEFKNKQIATYSEQGVFVLDQALPYAVQYILSQAELYGFIPHSLISQIIERVELEPEFNKSEFAQSLLKDVSLKALEQGVNIRLVADFLVTGSDLLNKHTPSVTPSSSPPKIGSLASMSPIASFSNINSNLTTPGVSPPRPGIIDSQLPTPLQQFSKFNVTSNTARRLFDNNDSSLESNNPNSSSKLNNTNSPNTNSSFF